MFMLDRQDCAIAVVCLISQCVILCDIARKYMYSLDYVWRVASFDLMHSCLGDTARCAHD